jgi:hypothetical protein
LADLLSRTMGGTVGVAIGQAIYSGVLRRKVHEIPGLSGFDTSPGALTESVRTLQKLPVRTTCIMSPVLKAKCTAFIATRARGDCSRICEVDCRNMDLQYTCCWLRVHYG